MMQVAYRRDAALNVESVVVQDPASGDNFQVQLALAFDEEDRRLGMDTYCLVREGATHYGGLDAWHVTDASLVLTLTPDAAVALELPPITEIPIDPDGAAVLATHMPRLTGQPPDRA